jgi:hypothetical protein
VAEVTVVEFCAQAISVSDKAGSVCWEKSTVPGVPGKKPPELSALPAPALHSNINPAGSAMTHLA